MAQLAEKKQEIEVVGLVGPAGSGKSYRAQSIAYELGIDFILDDGLLIKNSRILAGRSAKSERLVITATKRALLQDEEHAAEIREVLWEENPAQILILGISDAMVNRIVKRLGLALPIRTIRIDQVASQNEIWAARRSRVLEKKHVVPVVSVDVQRNAVGQFMESVAVLFGPRKSRPFIGEVSVVRPYYSVVGRIIVAEAAVKQMVLHSARQTPGVAKATATLISGIGGSIRIDIGITVYYGEYIPEILQQVQAVVYHDLNVWGGLVLESVNVTAKHIQQRSNPGEKT